MERRILKRARLGGKASSRRRPDALASAKESDTSQLASRIAAYAPHDGTFDLGVPGLHVSRISQIEKRCVHGVRTASLIVVAQGAKTITVGSEVYEYDASQMSVFSVALPLTAQITQASYATPYLSLRLDLDPRKIADLVLKVFSARFARHPGKTCRLSRSG